LFKGISLKTNKREAGVIFMEMEDWLEELSEQHLNWLEELSEQHLDRIEDWDE
jgi:hypothetical protein